MPPTKAPPAKRCPVEGCKTRLDGANANTKCSKCGLAVCSNHIFPSDHTCITKAAPAPKLELVVEKKQAATAAPTLLVQKANGKTAAAPAQTEAENAEIVPVVTTLDDVEVEDLVSEFLGTVRKGKVRRIPEGGKLLWALDHVVKSGDDTSLRKARQCFDRIASAPSRGQDWDALRNAVLESEPCLKLAACWMAYAMMASRVLEDANLFEEMDRAQGIFQRCSSPGPFVGQIFSEYLQFRRLDSEPSLVENDRIKAIVAKSVANMVNAQYQTQQLNAYLLAGIIDGVGTAAAIHDLRVIKDVPEPSLPTLAQALAEVTKRLAEPSFWKWTRGFGESLALKYAKGESETRLRALATGKAISEYVLGPVGINEWVTNLVQGVKDTNWRVKEYSLELLELLVTRKASLIGEHLPSIVMALAAAVVEAKKEVTLKAASALDAVGSSVTNPETKRLMPFILNAIKSPDTGTDKCLAELMDATFVNSLNATSVSLIVPVITRALREGSADLKRRGAIATGNVCALVRDVEDVRPFANVIQAELNKLKDHSSPEVRKAADKALVSISKALDQADSARHAPRSPRAGKEVEAVAKECLTELKEAFFPTVELSGFGLAALKELVEKLMAAPVKDLAEHLVMHQATSYLGCLPKGGSQAVASAVLSRIRRARADSIERSQKSGDTHDEVLVDIPDMILAYASRVLLSKTHICLKRGHRYGIVGKIGVGKTTLASRLAKGDLENFPADVSTYMVLHEVLQEDMSKTVLDYMGGTEVAADTLRKVGFENPKTLISTLSGGWRMRLAIAKSMLANADLIVLDEPTNHVDVAGCAWLASYLRGLSITCVIVSHDYDFLTEVATDVLHIHDHKLDTFEGGFADFQKAFPEIAAALPKMKTQGTGGKDDEASLASADPLSREPTPFQPAAATANTEDASSAIFDLLERRDNSPESVASLLKARSIPVIAFPDPGKLEGITSKGRPVMTVTDLTYAYDTNPEKIVLSNVSCKLSLNSRIALRGANGQGKSTLMKLVVGELGMNQYSKGTVWKHHNLRVAYVAQHAIHHLLEHLDITPIQYLQRRYFEGRDKERGEMITLAIDEADKNAMNERGEICGILSRVTRGKQLFYEIEISGRRKVGEGGDGRPSRSQKLDDSSNAKEFRSLAQLEAMKKPHVMKLVKMFDEEMKYEASGLAIRPVTQVEVLKGLQEFGIDADFAERKIRWLSGGQKSRLVLAAAMWHKPHLICLDEPTNFLDAETLAVLTYSLKAFKGAVLTVSHHDSFVRVLCNEAWDMQAGRLTVTILKEKVKYGGALLGKTPSPSASPSPGLEEEED